MSGLTSDFTDCTPIATPEQYKAALLAARQRMTDVQLQMLQAHCKAPDHAISLGRLADLFGLRSAAIASTTYSNYARWIAEQLEYTPENSKTKACWLFALAFSRPDAEGNDGEPEWIMRPELVAALQAMKWA